MIDNFLYFKYPMYKHLTIHEIWFKEIIEIIKIMLIVLFYYLYQPVDWRKSIRPDFILLFYPITNKMYNFVVFSFRFVVFFAMSFMSYKN